MTHKELLTIGFDAKRAVYNNTGLGNYCREVIREMMKLHPQWRMRLYTPGMREQPRLEEILSMGGDMEFRQPQGMWRKVKGLWRVYGGITGMLPGDGVDLFHGLSNELPLDIVKSGVPSVVTIHDAIYRRIPSNYTAIDRKIYDYKYGHSARNATRVVAISRRTAADIMELYDVDPAKIDVIYQSCHPQFSAPVSDDSRRELRERYNLPKRYIAMVGTIESRKNQMLAVEALPKIDPEVGLVIVGRSRLGYGEEVMRRAGALGVQDRVTMISGLEFGLLPALYAEAEVAAYPSRYEGFGLPVVEAISVGTPVVAATGSCLEEAGGGGALYVDPDDADGFANAANEMLGSEQVREKMVASGRAHIAATLSTPMAEALTATYRKTLTCRE